MTLYIYTKEKFKHPVFNHYWFMKTVKDDCRPLENMKVDLSRTSVYSPGQQNQHPETLGDGGSISGSTLLVLSIIPPFDWRFCIIPTDPSLCECLSSLEFVAFFICSRLIWFRSPEINASCHTNPDEPRLLKLTSDLWKVAMACCLS